MSPSSPTPKKPYEKVWLPFDKQVDLLQQRGLFVDDIAEAIAFLEHTNYYRISGYCLAFETERHRFYPGTKLADIRQAYLFDERLRELLSAALEVVELDIRTCIAHTFGESHGPLGHVSPAAFDSQFLHNEWLARCRDAAEKSNELFVQHYRRHYTEYPDLPIWAVVEIISFGSLSKMYRGLKSQDQWRIANRYGLQKRDLQSWLHHLVYVRNCCAHHARVWDRQWAIKPMLPAGKVWSSLGNRTKKRPGITLLMLAAFIRRIPVMKTFLHKWRAEVEHLFSSPPPTPDALSKAGLWSGWTEHSLWHTPDNRAKNTEHI